MILNEQGFWRLVVAAGAGAAAAVIASLVAAVWAALRRDVSGAVPVTAGLSVAVTAYLIDWLSDRRRAQ